MAGQPGGHHFGPAGRTKWAGVGVRQGWLTPRLQRLDMAWAHRKRVKRTAPVAPRGVYSAGWARWGQLRGPHATHDARETRLTRAACPCALRIAPAGRSLSEKSIRRTHLP